MSAFPIGVMLDSFRKPWTEALDIACELGASGIQAHGGHGLLAVKTVTPAVKKEFMAQMRDHGLVVSAICGDLGKGFGNPELNPGLIETSKRILDMAKELGTDIVTTHIGVVPQDPAHPRYRIMQKIVAEELDMPIESVKMAPADTGATPADFGSTGSRSTYCGGILPGVDLVCRTQPEGFKDEIVYHTLAQVQPVTFRLYAPELSLALQDNGDLHALDAQGVCRFIRARKRSGVGTCGTCTCFGATGL